jgi:hypothetical protein
MPRTCLVCHSPKRNEIDAALLSGTSYRSIARHFNAPPDSVFRHKRDHLSPALVRAKDAAEILDADRLIEHLQSLRQETLDVLAAAKQSRDSQMMLKAIARAEAQLRLAAELLGQLDQMRGMGVGVTIVLSESEQRWL